MMLYEHVFLGRARGRRPQRVCSTEMQGKQLTTKALQFNKLAFIDSAQLHMFIIAVAACARNCDVPL